MSVAKQPPVMTIRAIDKVVVAIRAGLSVMLCKDNDTDMSLSERKCIYTSKINEVLKYTSMIQVQSGIYMQAEVATSVKLSIFNHFHTGNWLHA